MTDQKPTVQTWAPTGLEPPGCPVPGACSCPNTSMLKLGNYILDSLAEISYIRLR